MNKQFKVGDQVVRINKHNGDGACVGQKATVIAVADDGDLRVNYVGCPWPTNGELWLKVNTELVQVQESPCKFVPGSTYNDRTGKEYRFVVYAEEAAPPYRAVFLTSTGNITCRHSDGILNLSGRTSDLDILPNKKTRTINVYRNNTTGSLSAVAEDDVGRGAVHFTKIGEVVEEYEEF